MSYYLGIDVGTSGTKALVMDSQAKVLAAATAPHGTLSPRPGWSEQLPQEWWSATRIAVGAAIAQAGINGRQIAGVGLSGQMHGLVVTDAAGRAIRSSIIWNDQRTAEQAVQIESKVGGRKALIKLVGNVAMTSFTLTKLLWVRRHQPALFDRIRHLLLPKDYLRLHLTGEYVGDVTDSSGTLMLDQRKRDWSDRMLSLFQIDRSILPPVVESQEITGRVRPVVAEELGLTAGTPVVGGAGDQPAGAVGNGVVIDGLTSATMGTSGVVYVHSRSYKTDPAGRVQTFCSSVPGEYCMFGCVLAAGGSLQWFRNTLGRAEIEAAKSVGCDPYRLLDELAEQAAPGCEGLFWLPYLTGERTPHADPFARACWIGVQSRTTRGELVRSVMEGATFAMNDAVSILRGKGMRIRQIRLSGGGARSAFWRQLQADVYGTACVTINAEEGPAYGVALLAAAGTGRFASVREACQAGIRITRTIRPRAKAHRRYAELHAQYRRLYPALKQEFARIAGLT
jgi:xylulokinase